jgi:DNA repair protein RecO (recombination protein O)
MPSRSRSIRVDAIVLRHQDFGEADRLLTLLTAEMGKLTAIAKGVRKLSSRKAGHLEPFTRASLLLARGHGLYIVTQAETLDSFQSLREDLPRIGYASYVVELLDRFTYEEGENQAMFRLLKETLGRLDEGSQIQLALHYYELRLLDLLGFRPQLFQCVVCQEEIKAEDQFFSCELGGVLCPACGKQKPGAVPVSLTTLKYLRHLQRSNYPEAQRAPIQPATYRELEALLQRYLTHLLERGLNTLKFIRQVL